MHKLFKVVLQHPTIPVTYTLSDMRDEPIKGKFYEPEIQKVTASKHFTIDRILKTRCVADGKIVYYVSWLGYPSKFYSFIDEVTIIDWKQLCKRLHSEPWSFDSVSDHHIDPDDEQLALLNLSLSDHDKVLWSMLVRTGFGYLVPNPTLKKCKHESIHCIVAEQQLDERSPEQHGVAIRDKTQWSCRT